MLEGGGADGKAVGNWAVTALYSEIDGAMVSGLNSFEQSITGRNILATSMAAFKTTSWFSKSMPLFGGMVALTPRTSFAKMRTAKTLLWLRTASNPRLS